MYTQNTVIILTLSGDYNLLFGGGKSVPILNIVYIKI